MLRLFVPLMLLGLSAIDPLGIAAMPILLVQKKPYRRSLVFLSGSLVSLMVMGLLFARGLGEVVLRFENSNPWFVTGVELVAGFILILIALIVYWRMKTGKLSVEPSDSIIKRLKLGAWQLFILGALLVAVQSILDVVFVVAMIHIGQLHLSFIKLVPAVATYAISALILQVIVIMSYALSPASKRAKTLKKIHDLLEDHVHKLVIIISFTLGCLLLFIAA